jgi:hypothetical protein
MPDWIRIKDVPLYYHRQTGEKLYNVGTVRWWIKHGKRDYNGDMVKLRHDVRRGLWMVRKAWVDEFINRLGKAVTDEVS